MGGAGFPRRGGSTSINKLSMPGTPKSGRDFYAAIYNGSHSNIN